MDRPGDDVPDTTEGITRVGTFLPRMSSTGVGTSAGADAPAAAGRPRAATRVRRVDRSAVSGDPGSCAVSWSEAANPVS